VIRLDFAPIRPRAASVGAVVWLYLGVSWLGIAVVMLPAAVLFARLVPDASWAWLVIPFWSALALIGGLGVRGALLLLQLRSSGRRLLEWVSWVTFALLMWFTLHVCRELGSVPSYFGTTTFFDPSRALWPFIGGTLTSLPFVLLARSLRSEEVRFAVRDAEAQRARACTA
jgi:hypothetical protein